MPTSLRTAALHARTARRLLRRGVSLDALRGPANDRLVFVAGAPRSGTTFFAGAVGSCPGFVDLGEVAALKAAIPELTRARTEAAADRIRRIVDVTRRIGLVGARRGVEQTPETAFVIRAAHRAFPDATVIHLVRDGRDVVASLLERGWLNAERQGSDDAGQEYGARVRFWVEPERSEEFARASDARRAAWAWRRYVGAARAANDVLEVRYERLARDPTAIAGELAAVLEVPSTPLARSLQAVHEHSIGRYRRDLTHAQLADVEAEAGHLLAELGYR